MSTTNTYIEQDGFGFIPRPSANNKPGSWDIVRRYTMTNASKASVRLLSWGSSIQSVRVPNKDGVLGDVVLGFDDIDGYLKNRYMGSIVGRVANRVYKGLMQIDDQIYSLSLNDEYGPNHLHGGDVAFDNVNWNSYVLDKQVVMSHLSSAGAEGYPGAMLTQVKYTWTDENQLHINIRATATKPTPANVTSQCLFNLAGHGTGAEELKNHVVTINTGSWTHMDIKDYIPTGEICPVNGTVYDLSVPTQLSKERLYRVPGGGYNHNLCIHSPSYWCYRFHARIFHPPSGRYMEVYSNHPGLHFYTGNDLPEPGRTYPPDVESYVDHHCYGDSSNAPNSCKSDTVIERKVRTEELRGKSGSRYRRHGGFVLSPQNYPNAINTNSFPSCVLYPGKVYVHDMTYQFGVRARK